MIRKLAATILIGTALAAIGTGVAQGVTPVPVQPVDAGTYFIPDAVGGATYGALIGGAIGIGAGLAFCVPATAVIGCAVVLPATTVIGAGIGAMAGLGAGGVAAALPH